MKEDSSIERAVRFHLPELTKPGGKTTTRNIMTVDNLLNSVAESENINRERIASSINNRLSHSDRSRKKTTIQIHFVGSKKKTTVRSERSIQSGLHVGLVEIPERRLHHCTMNTRTRNRLTIHTRNASHKSSNLEEETKSRNGITRLISRIKNFAAINVLTYRGEHRISNVRNEVGKTNIRRKRKTDVLTIRSESNARSIAAKSHKEIIKRTQRNTTITITKDLFSISCKKMFRTIKSSKIITGLNNRSNIIAGILLIIQETNPVSIHVSEKNMEIGLVSKSTLHNTRNRNRTRSIKSFSSLVILRSGVPGRAGITNRESKMIQERTSSNTITENIRTEGRISPKQYRIRKRLRIFSRNMKKVRSTRTRKKRNENSTEKLLTIYELIRREFIVVIKESISIAQSPEISRNTKLVTIKARRKHRERLKTTSQRISHRVTRKNLIPGKRYTSTRTERSRKAVGKVVKSHRDFFLLHFGKHFKRSFRIFSHNFQN